MRSLLGTEGKTRCPQDYIEGIRKAYEEDWYASKVRERQMAVALYFIDKLALRAGHEKDEDEADTVGCCTLKASACSAVQHAHLCEYRVVCQPLRVADPQSPLPRCILTSGMGFSQQRAASLSLCLCLSYISWCRPQVSVYPLGHC